MRRKKEQNVLCEKGGGIYVFSSRKRSKQYTNTKNEQI